MSVEPTRHRAIFDPDSFGNRRIDVIGAGATGSAVTLELAKLGVQNIHVWDDDIVEPHNLANQLYGPEDVGFPKVEALKLLIQDQADMEIVPHRMKVEKDFRVALGDVVFILTDTMESRKEIFEDVIYGNKNTKFCIETRMGTEHIMIHSFSPLDEREIEVWKKTLYKDEETVTSACGTPITVGATAKLVSSFAVWQFLNWLRETEIDNSVLVSLRPLMIEANSWN